MYYKYEYVINFLASGKGRVGMNRSLTKKYEHLDTPFFLFDLDRVRSNYSRIAKAFPQASIHYAVKANNHRLILSTLKGLGSKFEVGSKQEAELLFRIGVSSGDIIFSSPVKLPSHIRDTFEKGVDTFVFDSEEELKKLAILAPGSKVMVRLAVSNQGSLFPLALKFGSSPGEAVSLMEKAAELGLDPQGVAFHVGSQCERSRTWREAMELTARVWSSIERRGLKLKFLNIGGGFPVRYLNPVPSIEEIAGEVGSVLSDSFPSGLRLILEPGRYLVANSAMLVTTVIGKARRNGENWLFVDASALHGLMEALQADGYFPYQVKTLDDRRPGKRYVLSGPTCDPDDTIVRKTWLPEVEVGERLFIMNTGAYSFVYASNFHGFSPPRIYFIAEASEYDVEEGEENVGVSEDREVRSYRV